MAANVRLLVDECTDGIYLRWINRHGFIAIGCLNVVMRANKLPMMVNSFVIICKTITMLMAIMEVQDVSRENRREYIVGVCSFSGL